MPDLTRVKDALIPDVWSKYFDELTAELSDILKSGIMTPLTGFSVPTEGLTVNMPFWGDLTGEDEIWTTGHETQPEAIQAKKDVAVILTRMKSYGAEDLVKIVAGSDPMASIGRKFAEFWARCDQKVLLSILKGIFGGALQDNLMDKSTDVMNGSLAIQALNLLGDASEKITGIIMHSSVRSDLAIKKLLDPKITEPGTNTKPEFDTFLGRRVIVDDGAPVDGDVFTTYLFGSGAIAYAAGTPDNSIEMSREARKSQDIIIHRRQFIIHPRGVSWTGSSAKTTPSNTELATPGNWERVFELKNIPIIALKHKIG
jgi:hypothetical protein